MKKSTELYLVAYSAFISVSIFQMFGIAGAQTVHGFLAWCVFRAAGDVVRQMEDSE